MAKTELALTGSWGRLRAVLSAPRFEAGLKVEVRKATLANALLLRRETRKRIQGSSYSANAALTVTVKRSSKALVDTGQLFQAVTSEMVNDFTAFVGVLRGSRREGRDLTDLAVTLHEGVTIQVTQAMRNLFFVLWQATKKGRGRDKHGRFTTSAPAGLNLTGRALELFEQLRGRKVYPLKDSTSAIIVPPRPFLREPVEDRNLLAQFKQNWEDAVERALRRGLPAR